MLKSIFGNIIPKMDKVFSTALSAMLRPLARFLFHNGVAYSEFSQLIKQVYVAVAAEELVALGEKTTISRIAIVTGLTRKEVAALQNLAADNTSPHSRQNRAVRVISAWASDKRFTNGSGEAKPLAMQGEKDSFEALVTQYSGDMPYRAMLTELERVGAVQKLPDGRVDLVQVAYIPSQDVEEKYQFLGEDVAALLETIRHNIFAKDVEPRYQRKVCYSKIPMAIAEKFKQFANVENQKLLLKLNKWLANYSQEAKQPDEAVKVGVGVYYFEEKDQKGADDV